MKKDSLLDILDLLHYYYQVYNIVTQNVYRLHTIQLLYYIPCAVYYNLATSFITGSLYLLIFILYLPQLSSLATTNLFFVSVTLLLFFTFKLFFLTLRLEV